MTLSMSRADLVGPDGLEPAERPAVLNFLDANPSGSGAPLAVVIAAYNEEGSVASVVSAIPKQIAGLEAEVIVVVDGSSDRTAEEAAGAGALVCDVSVNRGQGAALRLGYWLARRRGAEVIVTTDADGQYEPAEIEQVVAPIIAGDADFVSGSRRLGRAETKDVMRNFGVVLFGRMISRAIGQRITDPACGLRAMAAGVTGKVTLQQPQYQASELMISAALNGYRLKEVPTTMKERSAGETKKGGNLAYGVRFGRVVVRTWRRDRRSSRTRR